MVDLKRFHPLYWLWLSRRCPAGSTLGRMLLEYTDFDLQRIYEGDAKFFSGIEGFREQWLPRLLDKTSTEERNILYWCRDHRVGLLTPDAEQYPKRLWNIPSPPLVLYTRGKAEDFDHCVAVSMVGTRRYSDYGRQQAYTIAYDLARGGAIVVSGMAKGIDGFCHRGALDAGGCTVAVLGCGIDRAYPSEHRALMEEIAATGLVLTEFPPGTPPEGRNFPIRNRIISGLSLGTMVVEADERSGAMITAKCAEAQGRDLFALPGKVGDLNSIGTISLIQKGAKAVVSAADILENYEFLYPDGVYTEKVSRARHHFAPDTFFARERFSAAGRIDEDEALLPPLREEPLSEEPIVQEVASPKKKKRSPKEKEAAAAAPSIEDAPKIPEKRDFEKAIENDPVFARPENKEIFLLLCTDGTQSADMLAQKSGLPIAKVVSTLTFLEIAGYATAVPGGKYAISEA